MAAIGGHQDAYKGRSDEWLTPPDILKNLGKFDLDPCSPINRPWDTANKHFTIQDNGLSKEWYGRIWMNPPYGPQTGEWLKKLSEHGNGVALIFARTETDMFHRFGWETANSMLFIRKRLHFYTVKGERAKSNSGGPSVLIAYGENNTRVLNRCKIPGHLVVLR